MLNIKEETSRCLLCADPTCTRACKSGLDPARAVRSVYFDNPENAPIFVDSDICEECFGECEQACVHYDTPIRIRELVNLLTQKSEPKKTDLSTQFLGVHFENPFILSSSIVAGSYDMCAAAFKAGWAGAAFKTIGFLKPKEVSPRFDAISKESAPFIGFRNLEQISDRDLSRNLDDLNELIYI